MTSPSKSIYVLLLSIILVAGCLNTGSTADAEDDSNLASVVSVEMSGDALIYTDTNCSNAVYLQEFWHAMTDWDGQIVNAGYDTNLDGSIDVPVTSAQGHTNISLLMADFESSLTNSNVVRTSIVFGAEDSSGDWTSSEIFTLTATYSQISGAPCGAPGSSYSTRNTIDANDAAASVSAATDDTLMKMSFGYAENDLSWSFLSIKLEIGDNTYDCATDTSEECTISEEDADGVWSQNEHITLSENGVDIMNSAGEVNIYVMFGGYSVAGDSSVAVA